jgi:hypothetical protein
MRAGELHYGRVRADGSGDPRGGSWPARSSHARRAAGGPPACLMSRSTWESGWALRAAQARGVGGREVRALRCPQP